MKTCKGCTVTAPSLLLAADMKAVNWAKTFDRAAKKKVKIWAVHNHIDVNRNLKTGTKTFLGTRAARCGSRRPADLEPLDPGRRKIKQYNHKTAVRAIRNIFKLQKLSTRRIKRIYVYNWYGTKAKRPRWDSGLFNPTGTRARRSRRSRRRCGSTLDEPQRHGQQRGRGAVAHLDGQHLVVER